MNLKHLHVTCAIIENNGTVLAALRSAAMSMPLKWEFPGGKIHDNETPEACLQRELREELGIGVELTRSLPPCTHQYPAFTITLYPFIGTISAGVPVLHEHAEIRWMRRDELLSLDWAEADIPVVEVYLRDIASVL